MQVLLSWMTIQSAAALKCPVMQCLPRDSPVTIGGNDYTCYQWASGGDMNNMLMQVKPCPRDDQICDVFSVSDQSQYTALNPNSQAGFYREQVFFTNEMHG